MRHPIESLRAAGRAVVMAFSTFSRIPMPQICWEKANMRYLMCAFVLVGAVVGAAQVAWLALAGALELSNLLQGVGYVLVAVGVTGGIHLDGLADVADALSSHAEPARKVEIMKDPHAGAFALIALVCYLMAQVALAGEAGISDARDLVALGLIPLASRCPASPHLCCPAPASTACSSPSAMRDGQTHDRLCCLAPREPLWRAPWWRCALCSAWSA